MHTRNGSYALWKLIVYLNEKIKSLECSSHFFFHVQPENLIEEFRNECDQMKLLSHPNVVVLIDIIESASQITLIIELLDQSFFDFYQSVSLKCGSTMEN